MFQRHTEAVEQSPRERTEVMTGMRVKNESPGMTPWEVGVGVRGGAKLPTAKWESPGRTVYKDNLLSLLGQRERPYLDLKVMLP